MNKRVSVYEWRAVFEYWNKIDPIAAQNWNKIDPIAAQNWNKIDPIPAQNSYIDWILETWGINCSNVKGNGIEYSFEIIDESKFTLFMLKFPQLIEKISYE
jgi:hypothetical protein